MRTMGLFLFLTTFFSFGQETDCQKFTSRKDGAYSSNECCRETTLEANFILQKSAKHQSDLIRTHCPFGIPRSQNSRVMNLYSPGYICGYDTVLHLPIWVAYQMWDSEEWNGSINRTDCFRLDPRLPKHHQITHADYTNSGFDRGHLKPANDAKKDEFDQLNSFVMTNMAPQYGHMNRKEWMAIEGYCNAISRKDTVKRAYMITGSIVGENPEWIKGKVAIPEAYYKIFYFQGAQAGWQYWIFYVLNDKIKVDIRDFEKELERNAKSIDQLENLTSTNFFVARRKQKAIEKVVRSKHIRNGMFIYGYNGYQYVTDL